MVELRWITNIFMIFAKENSIIQIQNHLLQIIIIIGLCRKGVIVYSLLFTDYLNIKKSNNFHHYHSLFSTTSIALFVVDNIRMATFVACNVRTQLFHHRLNHSKYGKVKADLNCVMIQRI